MGHLATDKAKVDQRSHPTKRVISTNPLFRINAISE